MLTPDQITPLCIFIHVHYTSALRHCSCSANFLSTTFQLCLQISSSTKQQQTKRQLTCLKLNLNVSYTSVPAISFFTVNYFYCMDQIVGIKCHVCTFLFLGKLLQKFCSEVFNVLCVSANERTKLLPQLSEYRECRHLTIIKFI